MKTDPNDLAYPAMDTNSIEGHEVLELRYLGLTKREKFASLAMQGLLNKYQGQMVGAESICKTAVEYADQLITELNI